MSWINLSRTKHRSRDLHDTWKVVQLGTSSRGKAGASSPQPNPSEAPQGSPRHKSSPESARAALNNSATNLLPKHGGPSDPNPPSATQHARPSPLSLPPPPHQPPSDAAASATAPPPFPSSFPFNFFPRNPPPAQRQDGNPACLFQFSSTGSAGPAPAAPAAAPSAAIYAKLAADVSCKVDGARGEGPRAAAPAELPRVDSTTSQNVPPTSGADKSGLQLVAVANPTALPPPQMSLNCWTWQNRLRAVKRGRTDEPSGGGGCPYASPRPVEDSADEKALGASAGDITSEELYERRRKRRINILSGMRAALDKPRGRGFVVHQGPFTYGHLSKCARVGEAEAAATRREVPAAAEADAAAHSRKEASTGVAAAATGRFEAGRLESRAVDRRFHAVAAALAVNSSTNNSSLETVQQLGSFSGRPAAAAAAGFESRKRSYEMESTQFEDVTVRGEGTHCQNVTVRGDGYEQVETQQQEFGVESTESAAAAAAAHLGQQLVFLPQGGANDSMPRHTLQTEGNRQASIRPRAPAAPSLSSLQFPLVFPRSSRPLKYPHVAARPCFGLPDRTPNPPGSEPLPHQQQQQQRQQQSVTAQEISRSVDFPLWVRKSEAVGSGGGSGEASECTGETPGSVLETPQGDEGSEDDSGSLGDNKSREGCSGGEPVVGVGERNAAGAVLRVRV